MTQRNVDVTDVEIVGKTDVRVTFSDGVTRRIDIRPLMRGAEFDDVFRRRLFGQVAVAQGTLLWPNGARLDSFVLRYRSGGFATRHH